MPRRGNFKLFQVAAIYIMRTTSDRPLITDDTALLNGIDMFFFKLNEVYHSDDELIKTRLITPLAL